ncbi:MAG: TIGR00730 family Rossman fold protein, partial [Duncaniella sp.]|nr:TIGR00730 family Rossman fold protein [Duncaniella sp.]
MKPNNALPSGVVVYCASSSDIDPLYLSVARRMGELIAASGLTLVCGGGAGGMMAAAIEGAVDASGEAVGVLPHFMIEKGWNHPRLTRCID